MATDPPADLKLTPLNGEARTVEEWLTTFHLVLVVIDPYSYESAWILDTAGRVLRNFTGADCRVAWLATADPDGCRQFLGPWARELLTFADPDREAVKAMGLERLPALVHVNQDMTIAGAAEGWHPDEWRVITNRLAKVMGWSRPVIPAAGDPAPYDGSPALG